MRSGRSAREASSGAIASQASGATGRPIAYCAAANAVTATASSGPTTRPPRTPPGTGPAGSSQMPCPARSGQAKTGRQNRRGTDQPAPRPGFSAACAAATGASGMDCRSPPSIRCAVAPPRLGLCVAMIPASLPHLQRGLMPASR